MNSIKKYIGRELIAVSGMFSLLFATLANAQSSNPNGILTAPTNVISQPSDVVALFCGALNWLFWGLIVLSIAMFLVGGYTYATSGGDAEKVGKATKTLTYAAIGIVVALIAQGVPHLIVSFLGTGSNVNAC